MSGLDVQPPEDRRVSEPFRPDETINENLQERGRVPQIHEDEAEGNAELPQWPQHSEDEAQRIGRELGWDVVAHWPLEEPDDDGAKTNRQKGRQDAIRERNRIRNNFVYRMRKIGFVCAQQKSVDKDTVLLKIAAPTRVLEPHAEDIGMEMKSKQVDSKTGRNLYREFSRETKSDFVSNGPRFFSSLERQRLIFGMIEEPLAKGGAGLDIDKLTNEDNAMKLTPLHDREVQARLDENWLTLEKSWKGFRGLFKGQPLDELRDYFGEKIALYFAWLEWYTKFLRPLAFVGFLIFCVQVGTGLDYSNVATVAYAIILAVWSTLFVETWKRREATLAFYWDVQDFEEEEKIRPEFTGEARPGTYADDGQWVSMQYKIDEGADPKSVPHDKYFPAFTRMRRLAASISVLCCFLFILIVGTFAVLALRVFLQADSRLGALPGGIVAGVFNAIFIMFMNKVYSGVGESMNDWENHRTDTDYEDKLIAKQFSFKFVNSYAALAFIAFAKDDPIPTWLDRVDTDQWPDEFSEPAKVMGMDIGRCKGDSCMNELFTQLMTLQITMIFVSNFMEVGLPYLKAKMQILLNARNAAKAALEDAADQATALATGTSERTKVDEVMLKKIKIVVPDFEKQTYAPVFGGVLEEYTELMIQFGYVTLFATAFPLSSLCALFNNVFEAKIDGFKLLHAVQRPKYMGAEDIGTWQAVLEFMSILSVISNCAIICFTSGVFRGDPSDRDGADYAACTAKCDTILQAGAAAAGGVNYTDWTSISTINGLYKDASECLDDCACESDNDTCYGLASRIWIFVLAEHFLIGAKLTMAALIPDKPGWVAAAEARDQVEKDVSEWADGRKVEKLPASVVEDFEKSEYTSDVWDCEGHPDDTLKDVSVQTRGTAAISTASV